ncbi:hypothetical protein MNB_SV-4-450 [hydrothermal vent metagenome]|uniref:Uncharacterized protein n=1 Tax=hydrothermal vent metagenome TaxID=652676 RepID=A0A1W1EAV6_9ZZZZ
MKLHTLTASFLITTIVINANTEDTLQPTAVQSVRNILGTYDTEIHTKGELRTGFITLAQEGTERTNAYGLGGHIHFDTKRWNGYNTPISKTKNKMLQYKKYQKGACYE